jgi:hypothetical protein
MGAVSGQGTTFNLPNYTGELFLVTPTDTPFLSAIGGINGAETSDSTYVQWQTVDLRTAAVRTKVEGAAAPTADERTRSNVTNQLEIHQEAVEVSYTKLAAVGQYQDVNVSHGAVAGVRGANPVTNELDFQVGLALKSVARDVEYSFLRGTGVDPATNAAARETKGLIAAITTNAVAAASEPLTAAMVLDAMQAAYVSGGLQLDDTRTILVSPANVRVLTSLFVTAAGYAETERRVGGVGVRTIMTDFGILNVMIDRHMPDDTVVIASLEECTPVVLNIPGKGAGFFVEELARTGASIKYQLYGEIGLKFGNERAHAKITGIDPTVD